MPTFGLPHHDGALSRTQQRFQRGCSGSLNIGSVGQFGASINSTTLNFFFQLVPGMKGHHTTGFDGNSLDGFGITPGALCLAAYLEIAKTGYLDIMAINQTARHQIKKGINHVFGFALAQANLLKQ